MTILLWTLLAISVVSSLLFLVLVFSIWRLSSVDDADFWLRPMSVALLLFTAIVGTAAAFSGYVAAENQKQKLALLERENIEAKRKLVEESLKRDEIEKGLLPRVIPIIIPPGELKDPTGTIITRPGQESNIAPLKRFAGQQVIVQFLPEVEARRALREMLRVFKYAEWKVLEVKANPDLEKNEFWDGVVIEPHEPGGFGVRLPTHKQIQQKFSDRGRLREVSAVLIKLLKDNNWAVREMGGSATSEIPPQTLRVSIGFKPPPKPRALVEAEETLLGSPGSIPEQRATGRRVSQKQRDDILDRLVSLRAEERTNLPVEIRCPTENTEACSFGDELASILSSADGWAVKGNAVIRDRAFPRRLSGVLIEIRRSSDWDAGFGLADALKMNGVEVERKIEYVSQYHSLLILVGW